jgi:Fur family ferric uptake transcriptional regulator
VYRKTRQNEAIRRAIVDGDRPLSPAEILDLARQDVPALGIATVDRAIKRLVEHGEAVAVELPGEPPRYESGASAAVHHHHFHCDDCDRGFDIPGCPADLAALTPPGFRLNAHELVLYGQCAACGGGADRG